MSVSFAADSNQSVLFVSQAPDEPSQCCCYLCCVLLNPHPPRVVCAQKCNARALYCLCPGMCEPLLSQPEKQDKLSTSQQTAASMHDSMVCSGSSRPFSLSAR